MTGSDNGVTVYGDHDCQIVTIHIRNVGFIRGLSRNFNFFKEEVVIPEKNVAWIVIREADVEVELGGETKHSSA